MLIKKDRFFDDVLSLFLTHFTANNQFWFYISRPPVFFQACLSNNTCMQYAVPQKEAFNLTSIKMKEKIKAICTFRIYSFHYPPACTHPAIAYSEWNNFEKAPILLLKSLIESSSLWRNAAIASSSHLVLKGMANWIRNCKPGRD